MNREAVRWQGDAGACCALPAAHGLFSGQGPSLGLDEDVIRDPRSRAFVSA